MKIRFSAKAHANTDLYLVGVKLGFKGTPGGEYADIVRALLAANPSFTGAAGEIVTSVIPGADYIRFGLVGLGDIKGQSLPEFEVIGGKITASTITRPIVEVVVDAPDLNTEQLAAVGFGAALRAYEFKQYKTRNVIDVLPDGVGFLSAQHAAVKRIYKGYENALNAVYWVRDMVNTPANIMHPQAFAKTVRSTLNPLGVKVKVIDMATLIKMGAGGIINVGQASQYKPCMVVMEYNGAGKGAPVAMVGKGITYDTGGYSLKTAQGMLDMHSDMAGGAAVAGAMRMLAASGAKVNAVGIIAIAENMISDEGYKPTDILKTLSGQTVEVTNTDAEGRLVLADAMWYVQKQYKPRAMADIATLTGAALVALGESYAAVFANDNDVYAAVDAAAKHTGDKIWRMPLDKDYSKMLNSQVADMVNAPASRYGGACTAAAFLERFVMDKMRWMHIDMAPMAMLHKDTPLCPQGASGFGARLLAEWVIRQK